MEFEICFWNFDFCRVPWGGWSVGFSKMPSGYAIAIEVEHLQCQCQCQCQVTLVPTSSTRVPTRKCTPVFQFRELDEPACKLVLTTEHWHFGLTPRESDRAKIHSSFFKFETKNGVFLPRHSEVGCSFIFCFFFSGSNTQAVSFSNVRVVLNASKTAFRNVILDSASGALRIPNLQTIAK